MNNLSIRVKVLIPIIVLSLVIFLSSGLAMLNQKNLVNTSYVISDECSDNIEILINIESRLESIGKNMYGHCKSENATTKAEFEATIKAQVTEIETLFSEYEKKEGLTQKEKDYIGAMEGKFQKYVDGVNTVLKSSMDEDDEAQRVAINVLQKPAEDYLLKKIDSLTELRKAEMEKALESQEKAYRFSVVTSFVFILVALVMFAFSIFICIKGIVKPMKYISDKLNKMIRDINNNEGDLSVRININGKDEIGVIGASVNSFIETLQNVMHSITVSSQDMNVIVDMVGKEISLSDDSARDISAAMEELSAAMEDVSSSVGGISGQLSNIAASVEELSAGSDELLECADQMEQSANILKENAINNKNQTSEMTTEIIVKLQTAMEESKKVEQVKQLTNDILNIASQTNLLALNASIEAARAGEAGRGFSVVASEISQLSDSSRDTATHIQDINNLVIETVHQLTRHANDLVELIQNTILPDYDRFVEAGIQYNKDAKHVNEIVNNFHAMSGELRVQTENVQEFAQNISNSVMESSEGIHNAATNTETLSGEIANISSRILENKEVANTLSKEAERFTI